MRFQILATQLLALGWLGAVLNAQPIAAPQIQLPVTNGLIRWWPNLFDARDEVTGQEGVVMGVLPPVATGAEDETEFGWQTGWVQLQPAITNEVFTLSFWVRCRTNQPTPVVRLLGQESNEGEWLFQTDRGKFNFFVARHEWNEADFGEVVQLSPEVWQHVAIARRSDGTSMVWVDGVRKLVGRLTHAWPGRSRWLTVGSSLKAEELFHGRVRDLCVFDRLLTDEETRSIYSAGLPRGLVKNTAARLEATRRPITTEISTNVVTAPPQRWMHRRFTTEDGLPGNIVKAVLQARNGYLWVGTEEGLARFDGRQFRAFTAGNTPALKAIGQTVWSLAEDADGTIWAGIFGGLLRIRNLEFTPFTNGLPQRFVLQAEPAGDGSIWVAGFNAFVPRGPCWLQRYHPDSGTSSAEVVVPGHIRRLITVTNGVWLATEQPQQMHFWDGLSAATTVVGTVDHEPPTVRLASNAALPPAPHLRAWKDGIESPNWWAEVRMGRDGPVFNWLWDPKLERPWVARWSGPGEEDGWLGVSYDLACRRGGRLERIKIADHAPGPEITALCANREGGVWFGTEEDGLHFIQERLIQVFTTQDGLFGNDVRSVAATPDGGLWVATTEGLSRRRNGEWTTQGTASLRAVASDRKGQPWFSLQEFGQGALRKDSAGPSGVKILLGLEWQDPNSLRFARDGTLWVVCERGLTWIKPERLVPLNPVNWVPDPAGAKPAFGRYEIGKGLPKIFPLGLVEDGDGSIWMGSLANGLFHVSNGRVEAFTEMDGLPGNHCVPVHRDDSGALWIVAEGNLSRRIDNRFQNIGEKEGLPKDLLLDLIEDDFGNFWISGKRGIHRVVRRELEDFFAGRLSRVQSLTLGTRDGLLTPECSSHHYPTMAKTPDGRIWVATRRGLATFDPRRTRLDTQQLPTAIERLVVNQKEFPLTRPANVQSSAKAGNEQSVRLPPGAGKQIEFHFTATSLVAADRVRFRHRLEEYDSDWSPETDLRLAFYTNLRPGAYRFCVQAANAHGIWNDEATRLDFVIAPYMWETPIFYVCLATVITGVVLVLHRQRVRALGRIQELSHREELTLEKTRIAADMHDELGSTLTRIVTLGETAKGQMGNGPQTRASLDRITEAARDVTARMSELIWVINPRHDTLENLTVYLREQAAKQFEGLAIEAHFEIESIPADCQISATFRRNVMLVVTEALHNLVKHSGATEMRLRLAVEPSELSIGIEDNGRGFKVEARRDTGNGLGNMQRRMADLGGSLEIQSATGQGTRIQIRAPLPAAKANR